MKFDAMMIEVRRKEMRACGYWRDELFTDHLDRCLAQVPDKTAIVDFNSMERWSQLFPQKSVAKRLQRCLGYRPPFTHLGRPFRI